MEILEGNKLIAEFMGVKTEPEYLMLEWSSDSGHVGWWKHSKVMEESSINCESNNPDDWHCEIRETRMWAPAYDTDWSLLIPVWTKFRNGWNGKNKEYGEWLDSLGYYLYSSDTPAPFAERLAYAIQWFNKQEKQ